MNNNSSKENGNVAQYDGFSAGEFNTSVNLFRGETMFDFPLISGLPKKNGIGIQISATYSSNTDRISKQDNSSNPCGIMGLGWKLGYAAIYRANTSLIQPPERERYCYSSTDGGVCQLYQTDRKWLIGSLEEDCTSELQKKTVSSVLAEVFSKQGIAVTVGSDIIPVENGFLIIDEILRYEISIVKEQKEGYQVYYHGITFEPANYDFSRIVYFPRFEVWFVTDKQGIRRVFGGTGEHGELQYLVHYHGQVISSANVNEQEQAVVVWNLSREETIWGNQVTYHYIQDTQSVGESGLQYTKACYISEITDSYGYSSKFCYEEKRYDDQLKEYLDPYNPYDTCLEKHVVSEQPRYETKYLSSISTYDSHNEWIETVIFHYEVLELYGVSKVKGGTAKRLLTSIERKLARGGMIPKYEFCYETGQEANLGALKSILTATGTKVDYEYTQKQLPQCSTRSYEIWTENYSEHKVWNGNSFTGILLYNDITSKFQIYSWVGRFQKWTPTKQMPREWSEHTEAIALEYSIVLYDTQPAYHNTQIVWYRQDPDVIGGWNIEVCDCIDTEHCTILAEDHWLIIVDQENAQMIRYTYDLLHRTTHKIEQKLDNTHSYQFASNDQGYAVLDYDIQGVPGQKTTTLSTFYLDGYGHWSQTAFLELPDFIALYDDVNHQMTTALVFRGSLCVLANVTHTETTAFYYDLRIWRVADTLTELFCKSYALNCNKDIWQVQNSYWQPMVNENTIVSGGTMLVYDGTTVYENSSLSIANFNLENGVVLHALGRNCLLQSRVTDGEQKEVIAQVLFYEPENAAEFEYAIPVTIYEEEPEKIEDGRYVPTITGTIATFDRFVYDLKEQNPMRQPVAELSHCLSSSILNGEDFILYKDVDHCSKYIRIVNGVIQNVNALEGVLPEIPNGSNIFTTQKDQSLILFINTGDSFEDPVSNYQTASIRADNGFVKTGKSYHYDDNQAVCDITGTSVKYYTVDVYNSNGRTNGYTRYSYYNSLADVLQEENMYETYAMDGQLLSTAIYDKDNQVLSKTEFEYSIIRKIAEEPEAERTRAIYGAVTECVKVTTHQNGAISTGYTEFDGYNGEKRESVATSYNVFGDKITSKHTSIPAAYEYEVLAYQNRLTEVGETKEEWSNNQEESQIVHIERLSYDMFDSRQCKVLSASKQLLWNGQPNDIQNMDYGWEMQQHVQCMDPTGNVVQQEIPEGIVQTKFYSEDGHLELGSISNTELMSERYFICTFEPYENIPDIWESHVVSEQSVAGTSSLRVGSGERIIGFERTLEAGEYVVSFWSIGKLQLEMCGDTVTLLGANDKIWNGWTYHIMKFSVGKNETVSFSFYNGSMEDAYADIFSISPFLYPPMIHIYKNRLLDASVSSYGEMTRYIYDRRDYEIGSIDEKLCSLTIPFYKRTAQYHNPEESVNSELLLCFTGDIYYDRYKRTEHRVHLQNSTSTTLSSAVYVDVAGDGDARIEFGNVMVSYQQDMWTMTVDGETQRQAGYGCDGEWTLVLGKQIFFFFNGEHVFSAVSTTELDKLELILDGGVQYSNLICGTGVSFGVSYLDSAGRVHQGQMYQEDEVTITQYFYDEESRVIAQTKPGVLYHPPYGYQEDFAIYDMASGRMTGKIAEIYPEDGGFPYVGQIYESTPLGRVTESGLPGAKYAIDPRIMKENRKTTKLSYDPVEIPGLQLKKENYYYQVTMTPEGKQTVSILNTEKQQVASAALGSSSAIISASCNTYDGVMRIQMDYLPAYFEGNQNAVRVKRYDYCNRLISQKNPDMNGEIRYGYNAQNETRFTQTPELLQQGKVIYQKYNEIHGVIEEGFCTIPWEEMILHVNEADYPKDQIQIIRTYEYGTDIANLGSIMNLTSVQVYAEDGTKGVKECYQYDEFGRIITKSIQVPGISEVFTESCIYDHRDNVVSITNTSGQKSTFVYDASGRMQEETLADGLRKTQFSYTANDMIREIKSSDGVTEYKYTSAGWIREIQSPLLREQIQYEGTIIKEFTVELRQEAEGVPTAVRYQLTYDEFGRLQHAECYDGETYLDDISVRSVEYDHNGNILSMDMGGKLREYIYQKDTNRLLRVDDAKFTYNEDGAVTSASGRNISEITYENGKPVFIQTDDTSYHVLYDASGNRLLKTTKDCDQTIYLYRQNRLAEKISISDNHREQYLYGQYGLRTIIGKDKIQEVYTDHLGSPRVISEHGKAVSAAQYTPYGKQIPIRGEMEFGFNGYCRERETGLYYSSYRFYDPEIGRFYSLDPKESNESPYIFCGNDPMNKIDPNGDSWWGVLLGAVVGVIGIAATVLTAGAACPALLAAEAPLVAEVAVGAAAGIVGTVAGNLVTAACDKEPITAKMVIGSIVTGALSGLGALAGPTGQYLMRTAMYAGISAMKVTMTGIATSCTIGAAVGVACTLAYDEITDTPVSGVSLLMSGLAGMGTGLLSSRAVYGLFKSGGVSMLPVMIEGQETANIINGTAAMNLPVTGNNNVGDVFMAAFGNKNFFSFIDQNTFTNVGQSMLRDGQNPFFVMTGRNQGTLSDAVITCHGFGQHCFVVSNYAGELVYRPIMGSKFVDYFTNTYGHKIVNANSVKLLICFSGGSPRSCSTAQKFATALNKVVYGTQYFSYPTNLQQVYRTFV